MPKSKKPMWLYIARCRDGSFYTGVAKDVKARLDRHNSGHGAKYTSSRRPIKLVYSEAYASRSEALKREYQIKSWTRARKAALIKASRRHVQF
jgi:putative endonuclease